jgi:iron complex transport system substrate-binding protein
MRICSLVPGATEVVAALDLTDQLVAVSHECYSVQRTLDELSRLQHTSPPWSAQLARWPETYVLDANAYFSRPGPRLVDGVELLATILHPRPSHHVNPAEAVRLTTSALSVEFRS